MEVLSRPPQCSTPHLKLPTGSKVKATSAPPLRSKPASSKAKVVDSEVGTVVDEAELTEMVHGAIADAKAARKTSRAIKSIPEPLQKEIASLGRTFAVVHEMFVPAANQHGFWNRPPPAEGIDESNLPPRTSSTLAQHDWIHYYIYAFCPKYLHPMISGHTAFRACVSFLHPTTNTIDIILLFSLKRQRATFTNTISR